MGATKNASNPPQFGCQEELRQSAQEPKPDHSPWSRRAHLPQPGAVYFNILAE